MQAGSVIGVDRGLYAHYGILMDDGDVVHYTSKASDISGDMEVRKTGIDHFLRGAEKVWRMIFPSETEMQTLLAERFDSITGAVAGSIESSIGVALELAGAIGRELAVSAIMKHYRVYPPEEVQRRALSRVGERKYNLAFRNCEHFAVWCATGLHASQQVEGVLRGGTALVAA
ncbi:MAG: lecithin retinol acyltransferase family protein, partial [Rubrivivax sp.]|nr:lecithin retinol acyltransferase family protein [Rubrivivax sp.]